MQQEASCSGNSAGSGGSQRYPFALPAGKQSELPYMIAKGPIVWSGITDLADSEAKYIEPHKTSEAADGFAVAACKTGLLQLSPSDARLIQRADFDWRHASRVRDYAQRSQQLESQLRIHDCNPATDQFVEHRTSSGLVE